MTTTVHQTKLQINIRYDVGDIPHKNTSMNAMLLCSPRDHIFHTEVLLVGYEMQN
jgi:hypothetical protein